MCGACSNSLIRTALSVRWPLLELLVTDRTHYMWNYLSCLTELHTTDRHGETNLTKVLARSRQDHPKSQEIWQD